MKVRSLYGRGIRDDRHRYLPGPRRGLVNAACAATAEEIIFTESVIDALSFLHAGIPNAVPIYGVNGWTRDHDALIEKHRIRKVILALDADEAGRKGSQGFAKKLASRGIEVGVVTLPVKDANELLVAEGIDGFLAAWKKTVAEASIVAPVSSSVQTGQAPPQAAKGAAPEAAKRRSGDEGERAGGDRARSGAAGSKAGSRPSGKRSSGPTLKQEDDAYVLSFAARSYRVRGLKAVGMQRLKVSVRVEQGGLFHLDTLDLYSARARRGFLEEAAEVLGSSTGELAGELNQVIDALEAQRLRMRKGTKAAVSPSMSKAEKEEALEYLQAPDLMERIKADFEAIGCVGESVPMLIGYLAAISRKLSEPLAVLFCARSGAGKSNMQERITELVPPEDLVY